MRASRPVCSTRASVILAVLATLVAGATAAGQPTSDETWTMADSPVVIATDLVIPEGVTVTAEPGVVIELLQGARLFVQGTLQGAGTPSLPITFDGSSSYPTRVAVSGTLDLSNAVVDIVMEPGLLGTMLFADTTFTSNGALSNVVGGGTRYFISLDNVTFDQAYLWTGAGTLRLKDTSFSDFVSIGGALVRMDNVSVTGAPGSGFTISSYEQPVYVDNLTVTGSAGAGLHLDDGNFFIGSNVQLSGNLYTAQIGGAGILPGSTLPASGNLNDEIDVEFSSTGAWSMVWADAGIPYAMRGGQYHAGTLDILPGVTVRLEPDFTLWGDSGIVRVRGLPDAPVRFERLEPGLSWQGLQYFYRYENCVIDGGQVGARFHSASVAGYMDNCVVQNNDFGMQNDAWVRKTRFLNNGVGSWGDNIPQALESSTNPNSFVGNTLGAQSSGGSLVDARFNWWGDPSGPTSPSNPGGSGDAVDSLVLFDPFLTAEPDFADDPPVVRLLDRRRENNGGQYSSFVDPGTAVIVTWTAEDDVAVAAQRIEFHHPFDGWSVVGELDGASRSFEWVVPDIDFVVNGVVPRLRVIAIDSAGQEGWDDLHVFIPTGDEPGTVTVTTSLNGTYVAGEPIGQLCWNAEGVGNVVVAALSFDGDRRMIPLGSSFTGCLPLQTAAPYLSSDTVRFRLHSQGTTNRVKHFFSDYFTIRPDPRLGDEPPTVNMTTPVGGESFPGGSIVPIVWTAVDDEAIRFIDIQASFDGGRTWHLIAQELPPATTSFDWKLPASAGIAEVRVRVMASDLHYQTSTDGGDVTFAIAPGSVDCSGTPGEVSGVGADPNKITVHWSSTAPGDLYDLARGSLASLQSGQPASCMASDIVDTSHDDLDVPSSGTGFYYLVRASNDCGVGPWGPGTSTTRSATCP